MELFFIRSFLLDFLFGSVKSIKERYHGNITGAMETITAISRLKIVPADER
jgi:hypothetical protein